MIRTTALSFGLAVCLAGCATQSSVSPPAQARAEQAKPEAKGSPPAKAEDSAKPPEKAGATAGSTDSETGWTRKASRPPSELITGANLIYVFNFKESPIGQEARDRCVAEVGDGGRELAACLEKARSKIPVESVRFIKKPSGELWWVTYNRYKGNLLKWHSVQFQAGEESAERITLNLIGKDKGIAPMARVPRSLLIDLPNDYTIVLDDPDYGPMTYDAKIGTLEDD